MKKKTIISYLSLMAILLMPFHAAHAQETTETVLCMVLTQKDGSVSKFALRDAPVVTYEGGNIIVKCGGQQLSTEMSGIDTFKFEEEVISYIAKMQDSEPKHSFSFNEANFTGMKPDAVVRVYTADGKILKTARANADGVAHIDLGMLPQGIYILRTPTQSYKVKK